MVSAVCSRPSAISGRSLLAWRGVEAQHIVSTLRLVDTPAEQSLLEQLLEGSKPPLPSSASRLHYLLATPFRYHPLRSGSRFRGPTDPGVFYGGECARTTCAELGYWRWKFLQDAVGLERLEPTAHTAFRVKLATSMVDLRQPGRIADVLEARVPAAVADVVAD